MAAAPVSDGCAADGGVPLLPRQRAWTAHQQGTPWDADGFLAAVEKFGPDADFIVAPDIVEGGQDSLWLSLRYLVPIRRLAGPKPWILIPAQNGLGVREFHSYIHGGRIVKTGVFIGGSTEYKLAAIRLFGPWCKARDVWCHAGRVNSQRRIRLCANAGITSFDGSGPSRFAKHLDVLERELRQGCLFLPEVGL